MIDLKNPHLNFGLSSEQASHRLEIYGKNNEKIYPSSKLSFTSFLECLTNLFNVLLFTSGIIYLVLYAIDGLNDFEGVCCKII